jgi:hypothetical protein
MAARVWAVDYRMPPDHPFATGDPGWPAYDPRQRLTCVFDIPPTVTAYPEETSRRLWQDHFPPSPLPLTS